MITFIHENTGQAYRSVSYLLYIIYSAIYTYLHFLHLPRPGVYGGEGEEHTLHLTVPKIPGTVL